MSLRAYRAALVEELRAQWKEDFRRILGEFFREIGLETPESRRELIARQMHVRIATKVKPPKPTKRSPRTPTCPRYRSGKVYYTRDPVTGRQISTGCRDLTAAKLYRARLEREAADPAHHPSIEEAEEAIESLLAVGSDTEWDVIDIRDGLPLVG